MKKSTSNLARQPIWTGMKSTSKDQTGVPRRPAGKNVGGVTKSSSKIPHGAK